MKIAVASGKGGTGKTTIAVGLALCAGEGAQLLDCDVEEPNVHIFLPGENLGERVVSILVPQIIEGRCTAAEGCDICARFCRFGAIACLGASPVVFPELCHGCGGCRRACPKKAIRETPQPSGTVTISHEGGLALVQGKLDIGMTLASVVIRNVKEEIRPGSIAIIDSPPGTSCPVVATLQDTDFVVLVSEPTPFGLNDLRLAVDLVREMKIPFGVVVNRDEAGQDCLDRYCEAESIGILARIPDDRRIASAGANGIPITGALPEYRAVFASLLAGILAGKDDSCGR